MDKTSNNYSTNRHILRTALPESCPCPYCNAVMENAAGPEQYHSVTMDHIKPKSKGGNNQLDNLIAVCRFCNGRKSDKEKVLFFKLNTPQLLTKNEYYGLRTYLEMSNRLGTLKDIRTLIAEDEIESALTKLNFSKEIGTRVKIFDTLIRFIKQVVGKVQSIVIQIKKILERLDLLISDLDKDFGTVTQRVAHLSFTTYAL